VGLTKHVCISFFFNALHASITMALKLRKEHGMASSMVNLMEDDMDTGLELFMFSCNIKQINI
jgi:hypothetical protein